jgi:hypothetical protein
VTKAIYPEIIKHPGRICFDVKDGIVLVGSDAHIWPGPTSLMMKAFVKFCKELRPNAVILNGDVMDFPSLSKHAPIMWESRPSVKEEIEHAQDQLHEIGMAAGRGVRKIWTFGNHDSRMESKIANLMPELKGLEGVHLKDFFPQWEPCWSTWVNDSVVVKHRFKGGDNAPFNNVMRSGKTMVTGHLHSAKVIAYTDYSGTRYGVDSGCLANPDAKAFVDYTEDNPKNWRRGFAVLTFLKGRLLQPELVLAWDQKSVEFRGKVIQV